MPNQLPVLLSQIYFALIRKSVHRNQGMVNCDDFVLFIQRFLKFVIFFFLENKDAVEMEQFLKKSAFYQATIFVEAISNVTTYPVALTRYIFALLLELLPLNTMSRL